MTPKTAKTVRHLQHLRLERPGTPPPGAASVARTALPGLRAGEPSVVGGVGSGGADQGVTSQVPPCTIDLCRSWQAPAPAGPRRPAAPVACMPEVAMIVSRGAVPAAQVARQLQQIVRDEGPSGAWRRLLDFVDDFRASNAVGQAWLVAEEPPSSGDRRIDAALAGIVEMLCNEADVPCPTWTEAPERFVEPWWHVSGLPGFFAMALRDSPVELKRHGVLVGDGAFPRV